MRTGVPSAAAALESEPGAVATGSPETPSNVFRISTGVRASENNYHLAVEPIPNQIRESMNDCSANVAMHNLINKRCGAESIDY